MWLGAVVFLRSCAAGAGKWSSICVAVSRIDLHILAPAKKRMRAVFSLDIAHALLGPSAGSTCRGANCLDVFTFSLTLFGGVLIQLRDGEASASSVAG